MFGLGGNDTLIVDSSNGLINVANGIRYDGGDGSDELQLVQTGGPTRASDTYSVGPAIGSGVSTIVGGGTAGTQTVFFEDLEPVLDLVPAAALTVNATATDNAINYSGGTLVTTGLVTIDEHEIDRVRQQDRADDQRRSGPGHDQPEQPEHADRPDRDHDQRRRSEQW